MPYRNSTAITRQIKSKERHRTPTVQDFLFFDGSDIGEVKRLFDYRRKLKPIEKVYKKKKDRNLILQVVG